uniref:BTB domain-containing protein n=1 Tax=Glossina pallidipes TaxID=7398 RepID=A0A1B0A2M4_GLOPL
MTSLHLITCVYQHSLKRFQTFFYVNILKELFASTCSILSKRTLNDLTSTDCIQIEHERNRIAVIREFWNRIAYRLDDMLERTQGIVRLHDIDLLVLKHLIDYICTGEITITLLPASGLDKMLYCLSVESIAFALEITTCLTLSDLMSCKQISFYTEVCERNISAIDVKDNS